MARGQHISAPAEQLCHTAARIRGPLDGCTRPHQSRPRADHPDGARPRPADHVLRLPVTARAPAVALSPDGQQRIEEAAAPLPPPPPPRARRGGARRRRLRRRRRRPGGDRPRHGDLPWGTSRCSSSASRSSRASGSTSAPGSPSRRSSLFVPMLFLLPAQLVPLARRGRASSWQACPTWPRGACPSGALAMRLGDSWFSAWARRAAHAPRRRRRPRRRLVALHRRARRAARGRLRRVWVRDAAPRRRAVAARAARRRRAGSTRSTSCSSPVGLLARSPPTGGRHSRCSSCRSPRSSRCSPPSAGRASTTSLELSRRTAARRSSSAT